MYLLCSLRRTNAEYAEELEKGGNQHGLFLLFNAAFPDKEADIYCVKGIFFNFIMFYCFFL
jgi:hypothetical protein